MFCITRPGFIVPTEETPAHAFLLTSELEAVAVLVLWEERLELEASYKELFEELGGEIAGASCARMLCKWSLVADSTRDLET